MNIGANIPRKDISKLNLVMLKGGNKSWVRQADSSQAMFQSTWGKKSVHFRQKGLIIQSYQQVKGTAMQI